MRLKRIAVLAAASLGITAVAAGIGLTTAEVASAHTGDLDATAVCQTDGTYKVTYKLTISQTNEVGASKWSIGSTTFAHTPTSNNDLPGTVQGTVASSGAETITLGTQTIPGTSTQANWAYAFTTWSPDGYSKGSDGGDISLDGKCKPAITKDSSASVTATDGTCSAPGHLVYGAINAAVFSGTANGTNGPASYNVNATSTAGHAFPDGSTVKNFTGTIQGKIDANSDQCASHDATASVSITGPTCDAAGSASSSTSHASLDAALDETPGTHTAHFTADSGHRFADGSKTKAVEYTIAPKVTGDDCASIVTPVAPLVTQDTCTGPGTESGFSVTLADGPEGVTYAYDADSMVVTATADAGHKFGDLPDGWVKIDAHHATYKVTKTSPGDCIINTNPVNPDVTQPVCTGPGQASDGTITPVDTVGITYSVDGQTVTATPDEGYRIVLSDGSDWTLNEDGTATLTVTFDNPGDCVVQATPASVTQTGATCTTDGSLTIPTQPEGVLVTPAAGTYGPGEYDVSFSAADGYVLTANPSGHFTVQGKDGAKCLPPKPAGHSTHSQKCVDGDLVFTSSEYHFVKNEAGDGWIKVATSSQSIKKDAKKCERRSTPVPHNIDAGLTSTNNQSSNEYLLGAGLGLLLMTMAGTVLVAARRRGTK